MVVLEPLLVAGFFVVAALLIGLFLDDDVFFVGAVPEFLLATPCPGATIGFPVARICLSALAFRAASADLADGGASALLLLLMMLPARPTAAFFAFFRCCHSTYRSLSVPVKAAKGPGSLFSMMDAPPHVPSGGKKRSRACKSQ